jgi:hypothetical protein
MAVISMAVLCCLFLQRVISHFGDVSQPPCSPDLAAPDYCCSLNHSYIYRQLMRQWLVFLITRRERKQTSYYKKPIYLLYWSSKQAWWYCMGADFNCTTSTTYNRRSIPGILEVRSGPDNAYNNMYPLKIWNSVFFIIFPKQSSCITFLKLVRFVFAMNSWF